MMFFNYGLLWISQTVWVFCACFSIFLNHFHLNDEKEFKKKNRKKYKINTIYGLQWRHSYENKYNSFSFFPFYPLAHVFAKGDTCISSLTACMWLFTCMGVHKLALIIRISLQHCNKSNSINFQYYRQIMPWDKLYKREDIPQTLFKS